MRSFSFLRTTFYQSQGKYVQFASLYISNELVGQITIGTYEWDSLYDAQLANRSKGTYVLKVEANLKALAANAQRFCLDDTTNRILNKVPIEKIRSGKKTMA